MISKKYRLNEREFRKVLSKRKPFFSYGLVANTMPNTLGYARCGISLSGKQTRGSVNRNSIRRFFYDTSREFIEGISLDVVFVAKKGVVFDSKNREQRESLKKDILFLWYLLKKKNPQ